jgi:5'(3')-deoxyribonucleotidase
MKKKILYLDMDGVIADFDKGIKFFDPDIQTGLFDTTQDKVDAICEANPDIFHNLPPIEGAIEATKELSKIFELYFLSTPMWNVPLSFAGKRIWLETHFGEMAEKKLILTHRKDLSIGHILVDDTLRNGVDGFKGIHVHFGTDKFPNWETTLKYLQGVAGVDKEVGMDKLSGMATEPGIEKYLERLEFQKNENGIYIYFSDNEKHIINLTALLEDFKQHITDKKN